MSKENQKPPADKLKLDVIIPAYNEEHTIAEVIKRASRLPLADPRSEIRLVVVDDASEDRTADIARTFENVKVLGHTHNRGKGAAIRTGLTNSFGDIVSLLDADMEYFPEDIPRLISPIVNGDADMVLGTRFSAGPPQGMRLSHAIGNVFLSLVTRHLFKTTVTDVMTGHKAFRRCSLESLGIEKRGFDFETEVVGKALIKNLRLSEVPIQYKSRETGKTKINWLDGIRSLVTLFKCRFS